MIEEIDALEEALRGTALEGRPISKVWTDALASAFSVELDVPPTDEEWSSISTLAKSLGRYAVLTTTDNVDMKFADERPWAEEGLSAVEQFMADALLVDVDQFFSTGPRSAFSATRTCGWVSWLDEAVDRASHPLLAGLQRFGESPSVQQLRDLHAAGELQTDAAFQRWLLDWELQRFGAAALAPGPVHHLERGEPNNEYVTALFLPTTESWHAFLHVGWAATAEKAAVMRRWQQTYGAELTYSWCGTLHMRVQRRPKSIDEAFALAVEHDDFAPCTLGIGDRVSLRDHARALLTTDYWRHYDQP